MLTQFTQMIYQTLLNVMVSLEIAPLSAHPRIHAKYPDQLKERSSVSVYSGLAFDRRWMKPDGFSSKTSFRSILPSDCEPNNEAIHPSLTGDSPHSTTIR